MKRSTRRIIFYFLVLLFAGATPILVGYSFGYTFDFSRAEFAPTGGIFIKSMVPRIRVLLDDAFIKETGLFTGSTLIGDISPQDHVVRLEKDGYHSWSKTVGVQPYIVTELRSVLLVPDPVRSATTSPDVRARILASTTQNAALSLDAGGRLTMKGKDGSKVIASNVHSFGATEDAVLFVEDNGFFARYDSANETLTTVGRPGFYLTTSRLRFFPSPSGLYAGVIDNSGGLFLFDAARNEIRPVDGGVKTVWFDQDEEKLLIQKAQSAEILWLKANRYQPFQEAGAKETLLALDRPIEETRWLYQDNAHIFFRTANGIFMTEVDGRGGRDTIRLVSGRTSGLISHPDFPNTVFFQDSGVTYQIEL